jgi:hypothetical protein
MKQKKSKNSGIGAGTLVASLAGLTAAAVGTYFLYGHKDAVKNRKIVKGWMLKAKGEVLEELEKIEDVSEEGFFKAVSAVVKKYNQLKHITPAEIEEFMGDMKDSWVGMQKKTKKTTKKNTSKKTKK